MDKLFSEINIQGLNCLVKHENIQEEKPAPILIFLHGMGTRGTDIELLKNNPFFRAENTEMKYFRIIAPQCHADTWFDVYEKLMNLVAYVHANRESDDQQVCLMGTSMGGYATWQLGMSMPDYFDAIVPICGAGMYANASRLRELPTWAFHGALDPTVDVMESIRMVQAIRASGGNPRMTIYEDLSHNCWDRVYTDPDVFRWMRSQYSRNGPVASQSLSLEQYG